MARFSSFEAKARNAAPKSQDSRFTRYFALSYAILQNHLTQKKNPTVSGRVLPLIPMKNSVVFNLE